jgi:gluconate 2-dehydrogenase gamma chain
MQDKLHAVRAGLAEFNIALSDNYPDSSFEGLADDDQDAFLKTRERSGFFELMRWLTILGFFSMETYGGNKDHVGWKLIGFEGHKGVWTYPFGHYDAQVHGESTDGE